MWIDAQVNSEGQSCPRGNLNQLYRGISFRFPLCNHFDWPDSESVFGISQAPSMCVGTCFSLNGFYQRGLWVGLTLLPFWTPRSFLLGKSSFLWLQEWEICGLFLIWAAPSLFPWLSCCKRSPSPLYNAVRCLFCTVRKHHLFSHFITMR